MASLYEINTEIEAVLAQLMDSADAETGEVDEACTQRLEELQMQREEKLDNIGAYIKNLLAEAAALEAEEAKLKERREAKVNKAERLKKYLADNLDGKPFESARVVCTWKKSDAVIVDDVDLLPEEFVKVETKRTPIKPQIKKAIKAGTEVRGAWLENRNNLQIN